MKLILKSILFLLISFSSTLLFAQDTEKTVTITVSGTGKTKDDATKNALRNAIEQSFGAFISSKTEVINDTFVNENITSLSQGSIVEFSILSSTFLPDSNYSLSIKAVVSLTKMQKIVENNGHSVSIEGGLFGYNLKLFKLQSTAEKQVITDLVVNSINILKKSINYKLELMPPKKSDIRSDLQSSLSEGSYSDYWKNVDNLYFNDIYKIRMIIEASPNSNLDVFIDYFMKTISAIKMSNSEIEFAKQSGIEYYTIQLYMNGNHEICLRNYESLQILSYLFTYSTISILKYNLLSNDSIINYTPFLKNELLSKDINKIFTLFSDNLHERKVDIIDSSHYVLINGLLTEMRIFCEGKKLPLNYPSSIEYNTRYSRYDINFFKTNTTDFKLFFENRFNYQTCNDVRFSIENSFGGEDIKNLTLKELNVRYQILDFYMPLNDVEKLKDIKVVPF
jgi:hypothetical protein